MALLVMNLNLIITMPIITFDRVLKIITTVLNVLVVCLNALQGLPINKSDDPASVED